jgi:hypothetical protein
VANDDERLDKYLTGFLVMVSRISYDDYVTNGSFGAGGGTVFRKKSAETSALLFSAEMILDL